MAGSLAAEARRSAALVGPLCIKLANQSRKPPSGHNRRADIDRASPVFSRPRPRLTRPLTVLPYHHHHHHITIKAHCSLPSSPFNDHHYNLGSHGEIPFRPVQVFF